VIAPQAAWKEDEARKREEEIKRREKVKRKEEEVILRKEEEIRTKEREVMRTRKELEAKKMEQEARNSELEARKKEQEANKMEQEARKREQEARKKEEQEANLKKEIEAKRREEVLQRRKEQEAKEREQDQARIHQWVHVLKSERQEILDKIKETQKERSSLVTTKGSDELGSVESSHVDEDRPASRKGITSGTDGPLVSEKIRGTEAEIVGRDAGRTESTDQAGTLHLTAPERRMQGPPSRSESQSTVMDRQHDGLSSYSSPSSSGGGQRSGVIGPRPLPNPPSNGKASVLSLQERDQAAHPPLISKVSFSEDRDYPATAHHPLSRLNHQPEQRSVTWPGAMQPLISPPRNRPSEKSPAPVQTTSLVSYPSYAAPEGLSVLF